MKSQSWWEIICIVQSNNCCDSIQNNTYSRDSRNLFILRRYQCLSLFDSSTTQQYYHLPAFHPDGCRLQSFQFCSAWNSVCSIAFCGFSWQLGKAWFKRVPFFVNSDSFSWLSLWSLVPAGVWNGSTVLMLHSTGWGFPAQTDAGSPGNLAKEPAYLCQLSCCLVVYSCGGLALMVLMLPTRPQFTRSD